MYTTLGMFMGTPGGGVAGYPVIVSNTYSTESNAPYEVDMPATVLAGDLLIMIVLGVVGAPIAPPPTGWTQLFAGNYYGFFKWAAGTEGGTKPIVNIGGTTTGNYVFNVLRITGADPLQNPQGVWGTPVTTNHPDPPSIDPTWADTSNLIIAWAGMVGSRSIGVYPPGYTYYQQSDAYTVTAAKRVAVSTAENPASFTISASTECYVATLAVKGL